LAESDVELMRRGFAAFSEEGPEGLIRFLDPDFEMTTPAGMAAEPDTYRGHDGIRRYFDSFNEVMDEIRFDVLGYEDLGGGRVLTPTVLRARGKTTGIEAEQQVSQVWEISGGLARRCHVFPTPEEARAAFAT
jgi:ketosteroid isomerase-like protein